MLYSIPNPAVLLAPLTTQEAVLSFRIEGTQASFDEVLKYEAGEQVGDLSKETDIREIQNYRRAMQRGEQALREGPFNPNLFLE